MLENNYLAHFLTKPFFSSIYLLFQPFRFLGTLQVRLRYQENPSSSLKIFYQIFLSKSKINFSFFLYLPRTDHDVYHLCQFIVCCALLYLHVCFIFSGEGQRWDLVSFCIPYNAQHCASQDFSQFLLDAWRTIEEL